jgi:hypothetical protein
VIEVILFVVAAVTVGWIVAHADTIWHGRR